jgi:hypothetical protein
VKLVEGLQAHVREQAETLADLESALFFAAACLGESQAKIDALVKQQCWWCRLRQWLKRLREEWK